MSNNNDSELQFDRVKQVFGTDEIPDVTPDTLKVYFEYLQKHLSVPCMLTGIESMGYFRWEERYEFGYGSKKEYEQQRKERGSYKDKYELDTMSNARLEEDWDILVVVNRILYRKRFEIPLSELQAEDQTSANYQLLDDYSVWFVNWH